VIYVNVYVGQSRAAGWIRRLEAYGFGEMCVRGELPPRRTPWAYDNGAFRDFTAGKPFDVAKFERDLETIWRSNVRPDFMVVPDIVAGGLPSLEFSLSWLPKLKPHGVPLYLAVQDGMTPTDVAPHATKVDGLFVGGSLEWKVQTAKQWIDFAHGCDRKCHVGRMGTETRARAALRWGADSIDSCLPLFSEDNLKRFLRGLNPQPELALEGA
jgi:hypothetical protein